MRAGLEKIDLRSQSPDSASDPPHAGPHSKQLAASKVLKPRGGAKDVWKFFEKLSGRHTCVFCKYVNFFLYPCRYLIYYDREIHITDPSHHVTDFGTTTSTSNLRKHLFTDHIAKWTTACENLNIPITAAAAKEAIRKFRKEPATTSLESERPQYSKEAFNDALVDFVVGDDQVHFYLIL